MLAVAITALLLLRSPVVAAQGDSNCGKCYNNSTGTAHVFGDNIWWYSYEYMDCDAANACHSNSQYGSCGGFHFGCGLGSGLAAELKDRLSDGDSAGVEDLLYRYSYVLSYDASASQVVVDACVGSEPLRLEVPAQLSLAPT